MYEIGADEAIIYHMGIKLQNYQKRSKVYHTLIEDIYGLNGLDVYEAIRLCGRKLNHDKV
jgi:hypothetical protein